MRGSNVTPVRTVVIPYSPDPRILDTLRDVRAAVDRLIPEWRDHPEDSRFDATKRSYPWLREHYPHLASAWSVVMANETFATLNSWDRILRRWKRHEPRRWERLHDQLPHRTRLKASLHPDLFRFHGAVLDVTLHRHRHITIDLSRVPNPLFWKYGQASGWKCGLAITDRALIFNFRVPHPQALAKESVGVDLNMPSADFATSDGIVGSVDLRPISRIQGAMARKRMSVQRSIPTDLRLQRWVLHRTQRREKHRVMPLLHRAVNEMLDRVGNRNLILEDLNRTTDECLRKTRDEEKRRRLATWTHGQFGRLVGYKAHTQIVQVNPRGTSSDCPRCGGRLDHPEWRRAVCGTCQGDWQRDRVAAINLLSRGQVVLRGEAPPPRVLDALLEASRWGSERGSADGPTKEDEANENGIGFTGSIQ